MDETDEMGVEELEGETITIDYVDDDGVAERRSIDIIRYYDDIEPVLYALTRGASAARRFLVSRIREVVDGDGVVWTPEDFLAQYGIAVDAEEMDRPLTPEELARVRPPPRPKRQKIPPPPPVPAEVKAARAEACARDEAEADAYQQAVLEELAAKKKPEGGELPAITFIAAALFALFGGPEPFAVFVAAAVFFGTPTVAIFPRTMRTAAETPRRLAAVGRWLAFLTLTTVVIGIIRAVARAAM